MPKYEIASGWLWDVPTSDLVSDDPAGYIEELEQERDEARAQLANGAASEVDAVQGRQECERELREARKRLRLLAKELLRTRRYDFIDGKVLNIATEIMQEDADD